MKNGEEEEKNIYDVCSFCGINILICSLMIINRFYVASFTVPSQQEKTKKAQIAGEIWDTRGGRKD